MDMESKQKHYIAPVKTLRGHSQPIYGVIYVNNELYTSSADKHVVRWDLETGEQTNFVVQLENSAYNLAYNPHSNLLVIGENTGQLHVVDVEKKQEVKLLTQHRASVFALMYDEKDNRFYSGDRDGVFCAWTGDTFELLYVEHFHCERLKCIAVHPTEKVVAFCAMDGKVRFLNSDTFELIKELKISDYSLNALLFDGDSIYVGGKTAVLYQWNWKTGKKVLERKMHAYAIYDLAFIKNKKYIISSSFDKTINLWETENLKFKDSVDHTREGHRSSVNKIAILSQDEFVTVSDDRKIKVWKVVDPEGE